MHNKFHNKIEKPLKVEKEILYWPDGHIKSETWYLDGLIHRDDAPAITTYYESTNTTTLRSHSYWRNGKVHRDDGPAVIYYDMFQVGITQVHWHINGNQINPPYKKWPLSYEQQIEMKLKYS